MVLLSRKICGFGTLTALNALNALGYVFTCLGCQFQTTEWEMIGLPPTLVLVVSVLLSATTYAGLG
jgi:hypothetical protein